MFSEKNIVVTIGNYGAVVALHDVSSIKNKIFLEELNDESKKQLNEIFSKNKSAPIYVLLDTVDQSYKKKIYPSVTKGDLMRIIKRDMASDGDVESMKNYILLHGKKDPSQKGSSNRWECLFVASSTSDVINQWIDFLLEMPNRLVGIYMLPVESFGLFKLLKEKIKLHAKIQNKKNNLCCFVVQNKVSGIRQIVFSEQGIVFTRVVNYNFEQKDFLEKYEQDIYSTFEYLKRLMPDLSMSELDIVNIFPEKVLDEMKKMTASNIELNLIGYTPAKAAADAGFGKLIPDDSSFCDLLISKIFSKQNKLLKFSIPKIAILDGFYAKLKISYYLNLCLIPVILAVIAFSIFSQSKVSESIDVAESEKFAVMQDFNKIKLSSIGGDQITENGETIDVVTMMEFGRVEEVLGNMGINFIDFYSSLKFLKNFNLKLERFAYSLNNFNNKSPLPNSNYKITFGGKLLNKSGDIEDLFKEFDSLVIDIKKNLSDKTITYSDLPRNIDFNQKYYDFPVEFNAAKGSAPAAQNP